MEMEKQQNTGKMSKKVVSALVTLLLVCTIFLCFTVVMQVLSRGYASIGGYSLFRVVTGSMEPTIPTGSLIVSSSVDIDAVQVDDVICFRSKSSDMLGRSITHRVIGISTDANGQIQLQTKGDANVAADGYYVTADNLIGRVTWCSGKDSFLPSFVSFFSTKISFMALIALPCLVIAGLIFRNCVKNVKRDITAAMAELLEQETRKDETVMSGVGFKNVRRAPLGPTTDSVLSPRYEPEVRFKREKKPRNASKSNEPMTAETTFAGLSEREYEEMYARIRAELIEELKKENDRE